MDLKKVCLMFFGLLTLAACTTAPASKQPMTKEQYADELLNIVPPSIMFSQLSEFHAMPFVSAHKQQKAHTNFMRNVDVDALDDIIRKALIKHFTEEELKAMVAFYSTPEGRSCMAKVAPFAAEVVPACAHEATKAYRKTAIDAATGLLFP